MSLSAILNHLDNSSVKHLMSMDVILFIINSEHEIITLNSFTEEMIGYTGDEIFGKNFIETFFSKQDKKRMQTHLKNLKNYEPHASLVNIPLLCKNTTTENLKWTSSYINNDSDEIIGYIMTAQNIMVPKQEEKVFLNLLDELPIVAVYGCNKQREIIYWNKTCEKIYGFTQEEAFGKYVDDLIFPIDLKEERVELINQLFKDRVSIPSSEITFQNKSGSVVHIFSSCVLLESNSAEMFCIDIDLTLIKKQALEINEKDKVLIQHLKMAALGEMIENIAHQWRQPLSSISTLASSLMLQKELELLDMNKVGESLAKIISHTKYMSEVIEGFRNFIHGEKEKTIFKLDDILLNWLKINEGLTKDSFIEIVTSFEEDIFLKNYVNSFQQSLSYILHNIKDVFKNKHESQRRLLFINTSKKEDFVVITIYDNGGGIPIDIIDKVFEPYFTTKHKSRGVGLGLMLTYKIINDSMDGIVSVENVEYEYENEKYTGAQFKIELPLDNKKAFGIDTMNQLNEYYCFRWDKEKEVFKNLNTCNSSTLLTQVMKVSHLLHYYDIKNEILENKDIKVSFDVEKK